MTDDDEVAYLKRGVFIILLTGLLPSLVWLYFHIFFPGLLLIDITPKVDNPARATLNAATTERIDVFAVSSEGDTVATAGQD